jgi:uncharacterized membrane protein
VNHQDLANQFNDFAYQLINHHLVVNDRIISIQDEIFFKRIVFSRYYYALYHKYLEHNSTLSASSGTNIHSSIRNNIQNKGDAKLKQVFLKLRTLRTWADYELHINPSVVPTNLEKLSSDVYSIVKRININC